MKERTTGFLGWFNRIFERTNTAYNGLVGRFLGKTRIAMIAFVGMVVALFFGFGMLPTGFIPDEDQGYFFVNAELPPGASLERTAEVYDDISEIIAGLPGVQNVVGVGGYSILNGVMAVNSAFMIVTLDHWDERGSDLTVWNLLGMIQPQLAQIREAISFAFLPPPITGLGSAGGFSMEIQDRGGVGITQLETFANDLVAAGNASPVTTRLNQNFRANVPQIFVDVDREKAKVLGIPLQTVFNALQINLGSAYVNDFNLFGRTWKVMAQADSQFREKPEDIGRLEVRNAAGSMIPIQTLVKVEDTVGPQSINRFNLYRSSSITGGPMPGYSEGQATDEIERLAQQILPPQMGYEWSGVTQQQKAAGNLAPLIFSLAIIFGFLFLAAQYESWGNPLSVMLSVPMAITGAIFVTMFRGLFTDGMENNIYFQIGMVLLIGLSAKTAILIVEFAKVEHEENGKTILEAAAEAARLRFRAILMTAFSFILGVIPLVIASGAGAKSRVALGTAVAGGMLIYTILGVFFIPVLYAVVERGWKGLREEGREQAVTKVPQTPEG
jgi:HAE1 family hydrophobic/amphiphilic exporter-1